jgi:hypothetical protein
MEDPFAAALIAESWLAEDPAGLLAWLASDRLRLRRVESLALDILKKWAARDEAGLFRQIRRVQDQPGGLQLSRWLVWRVASDARLALALHAEDIALQWDGLGYIYIGSDVPWITANLGAAVHAVWMIEKDLRDQGAKFRLLKMWREKDPAAVVRWGLAQSGEEGSLVIGFEDWYAVDPQAALAKAFSLTDAPTRAKALRYLLPKLSPAELLLVESSLESDPDPEITALLAKAKLNAVTPPAAEFLTTVETMALSEKYVHPLVESIAPALTQIARREPQALAALLPAIADLELRKRLTAEFASIWYREDTPAFLEWATTVEPQGLKETVWEKIEASTFSAEEATTLLTQPIKLPRSLQQKLEEKMTSLPEAQFIQALTTLPQALQKSLLDQRDTWLGLETVPAILKAYSMVSQVSSPEEAAAYAGKNWFQCNPTKAMSWIQSLPANEKDAALSACRALTGLDSGQRTMLGLEEAPKVDAGQR